MDKTALLVALIAGFFGGGMKFITYLISRRETTRSMLRELKALQERQMADEAALQKLVLATAQLTITTIGDRYIRKYKQGKIKGVTKKELSILEEQFQPYSEMGANHWAKITMEEVRKLPRI